MSESQSLQHVLTRAKEREKKHRWLNAVNLYNEALDRMTPRAQSSDCGELKEKVGYCYYRAAFQAQTRVEFKRLMQLAHEAYEEAAGHFEKARATVKRDRCRAFAVWVNSWSAADYAHKKASLDECTIMWRKIADDCEKAKDRLNHGRARNELLACLLDRFEVEQNWSNRKEYLKEALHCGRDAISDFCELGDDYELARAYILTGFHCMWAARYGEPEPELRNELQKRSNFVEMALELAKKVGDDYLLAVSKQAAVFNQYWLAGNLSGSLKFVREMLRFGTRTKDHYITAQGLVWLADITFWMLLQEEDPDRKREGYKQVIESAKQAVSHFDILSPYAYSGDTAWVQVDSYTSWARDAVAKPDEKRALFEQAIEIGRNAAKRVVLSGNPESTSSIFHALSKALFFLSQIKTSNSDKRNLLTEASDLREKDIHIAETAFPNWFWYRGVGYNYLALILAELSLIEDNEAKKRELLEKAVLNMVRCLELCVEWTTRHPQAMLFPSLAMYFDWFGRILNQLYSITEEKSNLYRMIEAYQGAVENYNKADMPSRVAESFWQMAKVKDRLGEHLEAAENFESASESYQTSAKKLPHLREFYMDYASYMDAWREIETARSCHSEQEYGKAKEHYEKAATLHESSKSWKYLAPNYLAWARLEHGESLSRYEQSREAVQAFHKATKLFDEAKRTLQFRMGKIESADEEDLVTRLIAASDTRGKYCLGRIALEEARILDGQGDHAASSDKYGLAAGIFKKIAKTESEQSARELEPLIYLCQAWQKMMMAEAKASANMYGEAAELFREAKEHALDESTSIIALANSNFCKALEAGTEFEITREAAQYSAAARYLESAANYYVRAGFETASEYARATQRLFDAYVYMDNAGGEADPEKQARYYKMAERVLQVAAQSYRKAKHPEKSEQVQRLLEKVREEGQLAATLSQVLLAPTIASSTAAFITPTPSVEMAVGLERFDHAEVQVNLTGRSGDVKVGEDFDLGLQIVNVGKEAVLLTRVEEIIPKSFELVSKPDYCHVEDTSLDTKGKRLSPLMTESIRLALRPSNKGVFEMRPKLVYVDESGHSMRCQPKPFTINVAETILPNRIRTGHRDLDNLLYGGIPENYAVILTSPSCDERDLMIKRFLETGAEGDQTVFYISTEAGSAKTLTEQAQSTFYLFLFNPRADAMIRNLPNVFKLKGMENLTDIDITLASAFRRLNASKSGRRRACIEIVSDVLLQHHAVATRRWLTGLIQDLKIRGFTVLAVLNPLMHPPEEVQAVLGIFDGEIGVSERETPKGLTRFMKISRMYDQKYLRSELPLKKERRET